MKVTQEKLPASQIGLEIEIPAETSKQAYETIVQKLARSVRLPGFRKGKIPRHILLQRLGPKRVKAEALEKLIQDSLEQAIKESSIEALGNYQLISSIDDLLEQYQPGEPLVFSASVDVPPEVTLGEYKGLSVQAHKTEYDPSEVDELLRRQQEAQATLVPVEDRPVQMGDVAVVDYAGRFAKDAESEAAEIIEGTEATDFQMEMAEGKFVEGLVEGIVGLNPGDAKEITVTFPDEYPREDLAGEEVVFSVTLKEIKEKELPELDDDFAEEVSEFETMAELRESLESQFQEKAERETQNSVEEALVEELLKTAQIEPPETLVEKELETLLTQTAMQMQQYGVDIKALFSKENLPEMRERSRPEAIKNIQRSLALLEVAKSESLEPGEEAIEARVKELTEELSDRSFDPKRLREYVTEDLSQENALDWLREKASVEFVAKEEETPDTEVEDLDAASATVDVAAQAEEE